jgi:hypothetical protein
LLANSDQAARKSTPSTCVIDLSSCWRRSPSKHPDNNEQDRQRRIDVKSQYVNPIYGRVTKRAAVINASMRGDFWL